MFQTFGEPGLDLHVVSRSRSGIADCDELRSGVAQHQLGWSLEGDLQYRFFDAERRGRGTRESDLSGRTQIAATAGNQLHHDLAFGTGSDAVERPSQFVSRSDRFWFGAGEADGRWEDGIDSNLTGCDRAVVLHMQFDLAFLADVDVALLDPFDGDLRRGRSRIGNRRDGSPCGSRRSRGGFGRSRCKGIGLRIEVGHRRSRRGTNALPFAANLLDVFLFAGSGGFVVGRLNHTRSARIFRFLVAGGRRGNDLLAIRAGRGLRGGRLRGRRRSCGSRLRGWLSHARWLFSPSTEL